MEQAKLAPAKLNGSKKAKYTQTEKTIRYMLTK
jgi:hypothetical protein